MDSKGSSMLYTMENNNKNCWLRHSDNGTKEYPHRDRCQSLLKLTLYCTLTYFQYNARFIARTLKTLTFKLLSLCDATSSLHLVGNGNQAGLIFIKLFKTKPSPSVANPGAFSSLLRQNRDFPKCEQGQSSHAEIRAAAHNRDIRGAFETSPRCHLPL